MAERNTEVRIAARAEHAAAAIDLPLARLRFTFRALDTLLLPPLRSAVWRGVLGMALKRLADAPEPPPDLTGETSLSVARIYDALYAARADRPLVRRAARSGAPHPFAVDAPVSPEAEPIPAGAETMLAMTLVGRAVDAAPLLIYALDEVGRIGLGETRGRARLLRVETDWTADGRPGPVYDFAGGLRPPSAAAPPTPPPPRAVRVELVGPLRILRDNQVVTPDRLTPDLFVMSLVRRVSALCAAFAPQDHQADYSSLSRMARGLRMRDPYLDWLDLRRWSAAQGQEVPTGGIVGGFTLELDGYEPVWPFLWLGQWVNAGKSAALGMGAFRLRRD